MISDDELDSAVTAGVLDASIAAALRAHVAALHRSSGADEEHFRLVTGFNDVFVVIASALLLVSVGWIAGVFAPWAGGVAVCAASWVLAEFFVRRRRMALPAIVLLCTFVGAAFYAVELLAGAAAASAVGVAGAWLHWRRFQVPVTVAAGAGVLLFGLAFALVDGVPAAGEWLGLIVFLSGVAVFALAVRWDASDPARTTRRADVAFWLHLLAAPLLVHPVFAVVGVMSENAGPVQAAVAALLYLAIGAVSLALDRRALMVSALGYVLFAFSSLLQQHGFVTLGFALTALAIGSGLLLLSALWQKARAVTVSVLPEGLRLRLAPARAP
ncbi:hypothetical protein [Piscinibacter gummiphilus]|uniref:Uncharacterized protein n=1 Tax=Piscinibacter gummiphilus TaxID=946333 RepID=A0A1W6LBW2_9BURK|nr:hypothetical protein [Piscinibacter gummiphilus]ARN21742.1 hypothetical protein A4W93_18600 [Piscinibacter gummiphilus]ATU66427.1 hypothetical protein CPZ87_18685 [Piscinibacter gummiphilus]GLS95683.1 hypothetical protein GCM10007918_29750 [Piscinibacter gummiphilus]